jgi:hypothetical protein
MIEQITEHIEDDKEHLEDNKEMIQVVTPIKSKKARSDLQLQALANARQKAYKVRAEQKQNKVKAKNESKKTEKVSIELPESHQEITDVSEEIQDDSKKDAKDDSKKITDDSEKNTENENIRDVKKEDAVEDAFEESHIERIERHASRQEYNDYINNLIDERVKYKPIVKSKYKFVDGSYVIR